MIVNQTELSQLFRVTVRSIQRWEDEGMPRAEAAKDGRSATYDVADCIAWTLERERRRAGGGSSFAEARTTKTVVEAKLRQLELDQQLGRLVPEERVLGRIRRALEAVNQTLLAAPRRWAARWAAKLGITQGEAIALIDELVEDARADLLASLEDVARSHEAHDAA